MASLGCVRGSRVSDELANRCALAPYDSMDSQLDFSVVASSSCIRHWRYVRGHDICSGLIVLVHYDHETIVFYRDAARRLRVCPSPAFP